MDSQNMNIYTGMPYGLPNVEPFYGSESNLNFFAKDILTATRGEILMEYSEVAFILSEINNWNQADYIKGVRANMERLNIDAAAIDKYVANLPAANQKNVITQKYITLFHNPDEAWNEYRRT